MKRNAVFMLTLALGSTAALAQEKKPGELTDPLDILRKVDAATKAVKSVQYDVTLIPGGALADSALSGEVSFIVSGYQNGAPEKYFADAKIKLRGESEVKRVTAGTDYDTYFIIDHAGKIAYEDLDPIVLGPAGRLFQQAAMLEFVHDAPFSDELNGKSRKLLGTKTIGGEECYEIHVVYASDRAPEGTWCFSKKDFLPRQRTDHYSMGERGTGTRTKTITNLVVNPKIEPNTFKLKLPEGYKKTDDFAPDFLGLRRNQRVR